MRTRSSERDGRRGKQACQQPETGTVTSTPGRGDLPREGDHRADGSDAPSDPPRALAVAARMLSVEFGFVTSLHLPPDHAAAARARRFVSDTLRGWGCDDAIPDAQLLVSELVTNAVLHARSATLVTVERAGATVRISVDDDSPTRPRLRELGPEAVTGRGLVARRSHRPAVGRRSARGRKVRVVRGRRPGARRVSRVRTTRPGRRSRSPD